MIKFFSRIIAAIGNVISTGVRIQEAGRDAGPTGSLR